MDECMGRHQICAQRADIEQDEIRLPQDLFHGLRPGQAGRFHGGMEPHLPRSPQKSQRKIGLRQRFPT